jgi:hypothetical protein
VSWPGIEPHRDYVARPSVGQPLDVTGPRGRDPALRARCLDDFAMRELTPTQADDLYELINERAGRSLILTSNRSPIDWYPLFPNPVVAESLLDRLINNSHQLLMTGASYRPRTRPGRVVDQGTTTTR